MINFTLGSSENLGLLSGDNGVWGGERAEQGYDVNLGLSVLLYSIPWSLLYKDAISSRRTDLCNLKIVINLGDLLAPHCV